MSILLLKYWPLLSAVFSSVFLAGGFFAFVRGRLSTQDEKIKNLKAQIQEIKTTATTTGTTRDQKSITCRKDLQLAIKELKRDIDKEMEKIAEHVEELTVSNARVVERISQTPATLENISQTIRDAFLKIDMIKREFVSIQQYQGTVREVGLLRDRLAAFNNTAK